MEQVQVEKEEPHVLMFPFPSQGHVNSMLRLSRLLCLSNFRVTFLNFDFNHQRLLRSTHIVSQAAQWPGFQFATISDGLPPDHPRSDLFMQLLPSLHANTKPLFKEMLMSYRQSHPFTCIIVDGIMSSFAIDAAKEVGIPIIAFRTASACSFWCFVNVPQLREAGEIPFGDADMDKDVTCVRGLKGILRRRDLPSFFRMGNNDQRPHPPLEVIWAETLSATRADALILNTFSTVLSHIRSIHPNTYAIGPLHALLKFQLSHSHESAPNDSSASASFWEENRSCIEWLDSQPPKSVLYVSFGSVAVVTRSKLLEFWHGLANSRTRFLWVLRPDLVNSGTSEGGDIPEELQNATRERGFLVEWAPQEEVLAHSAVGGFLTHSGWNSTLESMCAGVPMLCWPVFGDQQVNSRCVEHVWKIGLDMKDRCERGTIEKMVRELMHGNVELRKSTVNLADLARKSVSRGGSSYMNFQRLIQDIRSMRS